MGKQGGVHSLAPAALRTGELCAGSLLCASSQLLHSCPARGALVGEVWGRASPACVSKGEFSGLAGARGA